MAIASECSRLMAAAAALSTNASLDKLIRSFVLSYISNQIFILYRRKKGDERARRTSEEKLSEEINKHKLEATKLPSQSTRRRRRKCRKIEFQIEN
jgi:hypothetical protein